MLRDLADEPHAVYHIYEADCRLLYVGIANNPDRRLMAHRSTAAWLGRYDHHTIKWFPDRASALAAEAFAIKAEHPIFNTQGSVCRCGGCPACYSGALAKEFLSLRWRGNWPVPRHQCPAAWLSWGGPMQLVEEHAWLDSAAEVDERWRLLKLGYFDTPPSRTR